MRAICLLFTFLAITLCNRASAQNVVVQALLDEVRLDSLTNLVQKLTGSMPVIINGMTDTIESRQDYSSGNEKTFQFMKGELLRWGYDVDSIQFSSTGKNLLAFKIGYQYPDMWVMLGAHYDNAGIQFTQTIYPGADDNASGTAAVLEAARIFANYNFPYTIVFALWDEEELGLLGSFAYVPVIGSNNETLVGYVNVDMLGWDGNNDSIANVHVRPIANSLALKNKALLCNGNYDIDLNIQVVNPGSSTSDHAPFWYGELSAIGITEDYGSDFNPYWHTNQDSLNHFNLSFYQKCSRLAYATIAELALETPNEVDIIDNINGEHFQVYPNPFSDKLTIYSQMQDVNIEKVILFDNLGQSLYEQNFHSPNVKLQMPENLSAGVYIVQVFTSKSSFIRRVMKQ